MPHDDDAVENVPISTSEPHLVGREVVQNGGELTIAAMIAAAMDAGLRGDEEATPKKPDAVGASGPAGHTRDSGTVCHRARQNGPAARGHQRRADG